MFADSLRSYFDELRQMASEFDEKPVIKPQGQDSQEEIHLIVTAIGGPEEVKPRDEAAKKD